MKPDFDLRGMRKKARVSVYHMARELGLPLAVVRNIEEFPWACPAWADKYVEALSRLTA